MNTDHGHAVLYNPSPFLSISHFLFHQQPLKHTFPMASEVLYIFSMSESTQIVYRYLYLFLPFYLRPQSPVLLLIYINSS